MLTYLVVLTLIVDRAIYEPHLPDHFAHLAELKAAGHLLLSGPATDRTGGFLLLQAESPAAAEALVQRDPLVARGLDRYEIREWRITDGQPERIIPTR